MNNLEFQTEVIEKIDGWLNRVTSLRTMDILAYQEESGYEGSLLEIGVYNGKYFSVLARSAQRKGDRLIGIDTFQWKSEEDVNSALRLSDETTSARFELIKCFSHECDPRSLTARLGAKARFISIDGSHEADDVLLDLELCEQIVSLKGVIAVDDFINPVALGVNEGTNRFFARARRVVPFAYIDNKLFLTPRNAADEYRLMIERAILADELEPSSKKFQTRREQSRHLVEQRLWGHSLITCPA